MNVFTTRSSSRIMKSTSILTAAFFSLQVCFCGALDVPYTGTVQAYLIPDMVWSIIVEAYGAGGSPNSGNGGRGGYAKATLSVFPNDLLYIFVGGAGADDGTASFNGGASGSAGSGGGASDVRYLTQDLSSRYVVAGGGGGYSLISGDGGGMCVRTCMSTSYSCYYDVIQ